MQPQIHDDFQYVASEPEIKKYEKNLKSKNYQLLKQKNCYVGEEIAKSLNYNKLISEKIYMPRYRSITDTKHIQNGMIYSVNGVSKKNNLHRFIFLFEDQQGFYSYMKINEDGILISNNLFGSYGQSTKADYFNALNTKIFEKLPTSSEIIGETILKGSFGHELIYNGKDGNNIRVSYREYKDDIARPAFFQDLTYNLKESDIIRYKNYKIKVHKATNEEIGYTVLED